jgi:hypothetical protein
VFFSYIEEFSSHKAKFSRHPLFSHIPKRAEIRERTSSSSGQQKYMEGMVKSPRESCPLFNIMPLIAGYQNKNFAILLIVSEMQIRHGKSAGFLLILSDNLRTVEVTDFY